MKKWTVLAASSLLMVNAYANESFCGYKDFFHLGDKTHPGIYVVSGYNDSDVVLQIVGPRSFAIRDGFDCRAGYAHVTVAYDNANWCVLDINDGPFMNHPVVSASCNGLRYINTTYDGFGSYSYSINIE
ncbi:TPA: hypothetical protein JBC49_11420 [Legionella pneumophila subsp. pneumophila]|nr:hypothetical protein [Legionella pneumophila subsp. pneumophila]